MKQEQSLFKDLRHGYGKKRKYRKIWKIKLKRRIRGKKDLKKIFKKKFWGKRSALTKKFIKTKRSGTPKLCWADQVKLEFGGLFGGQKAHKRKKRKNQQNLFGHFWQNCWSQGAQIRIYNFVFIKIFVGGCLDNIRKMLNNITRRRRRTSRSSPRPAWLRRR